MGGSDLRPLEVGEVFDTSVDLYRRHAFAFVMIAAAVALPVEAAGAVFATALHAGSGRVFAGYWFGGSFFSLFATLLAAAACMRGIGQAYLGGRPRWRSSVADAARRPSAVIVLATLVAVGISVGLVMLFVPGLYLLAAWSLAAPLLVFERRSPEDALRTSRQLVHVRFWPVLGAVVVAWLAVAIVHGLIGAVFAPLALLPGADLAPVYFGRTFLTMMACFSSAIAAVEAAVDIQRALAGGVDPQLESPLRVRIGINAGDPVVEERDVFGIAVQVAARIVAVASPGQILVSETVRDLASGRDFEFSDQGDVLLKGFHEPFRLYDVGWAETRLTSR